MTPLQSNELIATFSLVLILWAIIGGPMRNFKARYKLFVFVIAASLLSASLENVAYYADTPGDSTFFNMTQFAIGATRYAAVFIGIYVLVSWDAQCKSIKENIKRKLQTSERG